MSDPGEQKAQRTSLRGTVASMSSDQERAVALDQAFDYRGDVTVELAKGQVIEGYVFDRRADVPCPYIRVMATRNGRRVSIAYDQITAVSFTGRDTAEGKSWEAWVKKYKQKKAHGEAANLHPESLD